MFHAIRLSLTFAGNDKLPFDFLCLSPAGLAPSLCLNNSLPSCEGNRDFQNAYLLAEMSFCLAETLPKVVVVVVVFFFTFLIRFLGVISEKKVVEILFLIEKFSAFWVLFW